MLRLASVFLLMGSLVSHFALAAVPMGSQSQTTISEIGRRVILRWPVPSIYPGLTAGALICSTSGNAPLYVNYVGSYGTIALQADAISPQCLQLNNLKINSGEPFRLVAMFEMNDIATFQVFPNTRQLSGRIDFSAESNRGSTGVLQIQTTSPSKVYDNRLAVFCSNNLEKAGSAWLVHESSPATYPVVIYNRADACSQIQGISFDKAGNWDVHVTLTSGERFRFTVPVLQR